MCILLLCFLTLMVITAFGNRWVFIASLICTVIVVGLLTLRVASVRGALAKLIVGTKSAMSAEQQSIFGAMPIPVLITDTANKVLWYNQVFKDDVLGGGSDIFLEDIAHTIEPFDLERYLEDPGSGLDFNSRHYAMFASQSVRGTSALNITFFVDDTECYHNASEYLKTRPSVLMFIMDNYDELLLETRESERSEITTAVNRALEDFINETNGILIWQSNRNYLAIVEEQHLARIVDERFKILDIVRAIQTGTIPATLSIGVGRGAKTLYENQLLARQALDMALGRGGDQAAMKTRDGYSFFGGVSRSVEKRSKVKSRIMASALENVIKSSENVIIMGHKMSDLDAIGSAVGIARFARICKKEPYIVLNRRATMALPLYDKIIEAGDEDLFIDPQEIDNFIEKNSLCVVVDCHTPGMVEEPEVLEKVQNIVVIDHHRKMVDHIENTVLFYHETYSSSCSEMVAELLQYLTTTSDKPTKVECEGMLAGIMLDTKNFSVRTGVRTFDAASYLRRQGADPSEAKKMFATGLNIYQEKSRLIAMAKIYKECAIVVTDKLGPNMQVVIPQTADELLNVVGVKASIVAVKQQDQYHISARSLGEYNVQLVMEELGGGGHQSMAGAQIELATPQAIEQRIHEAIDAYLEKR